MKFNGHSKLDGQEAIDEQDVTFPKGKVPTKNPNYLQLGDSIEASRFEGSEDGSYEYELDLPVLGDIPSNNEANLDNFQVPTDADLPARKTTVASKKCDCCGKNAAKVASMGERVHSVKCSQCKNSLSVCGKCIDADADCKHCKTAEMNKEVDEVEEKTAADTGKAIQMAGEANKIVTEVSEDTSTAIDGMQLKPASINNARIKAAYSCATKLALAGIINSDECDSYADQLLEDGLRADVMIKNTQLLLRSAQASAERVAASAAQRLNTRTASAMSISTSPALSGSSSSAALDIQSALKGTWTMPKINED
jgi:hypothetical protein